MAIIWGVPTALTTYLITNLLRNPVITVSHSKDEKTEAHRDRLSEGYTTLHFCWDSHLVVPASTVHALLIPGIACHLAPSPCPAQICGALQLNQQPSKARGRPLRHQQRPPPAGAAKDPSSRGFLSCLPNASQHTLREHAHVQSWTGPPRAWGCHTPHCSEASTPIRAPLGTGRTPRCLLQPVPLSSSDSPANSSLAFQ